MTTCPMPNCDWSLADRGHFCCSRCWHRLSKNERLIINIAWDQFKRGAIDLTELVRVRAQIVETFTTRRAARVTT